MNSCFEERTQAVKF